MLYLVSVVIVMNKQIIFACLLILNFVIIADAGAPEIIAIDAPASVSAGDTSYHQMVVTVRNNGEYDGFNVQAISKSGKLVFTPSSYTSYPIEAGKHATFTFMIAIAGTETYVNANEDVKIQVWANNNDNKVVQEGSIGVEYGSAPPGQPKVVPTSASVIPTSTSGIWKTTIGVQNAPIQQQKAPGFQLIYAILGLTLVAFFLKKRGIQ